jgi:hypothetical protein
MEKEMEPKYPPGVEPFTVEATKPHGGIYDLPIIGGPARGARGFYDDMRPEPDDSIGVRVGKEIIRHGTVIAAGAAGVAVGAIIAL